jgi:hypothetical protein
MRNTYAMQKNQKLSHEINVVPAPGFEPGRPKAGEFKSPVSTISPRGPWDAVPH